MSKDRRAKWKQDLGRRLREERDAADLSQQQIADAMDASKQLVSHWEAGRSELTLWDLFRLESKFGFDLAYIATGVRGWTAKVHGGRSVGNCTQVIASEKDSTHASGVQRRRRRTPHR
jgi:ribosome-binding protein aMBF1 (putative translation factor)